MNKNKQECAKEKKMCEIIFFSKAITSLIFFPNEGKLLDSNEHLLYLVLKLKKS